MEKDDLSNKFGREFNISFTLLCYPLQLFMFQSEIHMKTLPIVTSPSE
jgi:hypothetical protein